MPTVRRKTHCAPKTNNARPGWRYPELSLRRGQRRKNSWMVPGSRLGPSSWGQLPIVSASATVRLIRVARGIRANKEGTNSSKRAPFNHLSSQKRVDDPFPTTTLAAALNNWTDSLGTRMSNSLQGLKLSTRFSHGHRDCMAMFSHRKSRMPKPPAHLGEHTVSQATTQ